MIELSEAINWSDHPHIRPACVPTAEAMAGQMVKYTIAIINTDLVKYFAKAKLHFQVWNSQIHRQPFFSRAVEHWKIVDEA